MEIPEIKKMNTEEKKKFFSMDLAERLIRVEQAVCASFNKLIPYSQTEYFKSLTPQQQKEFEDYLKNKKKKHVAVTFLIIFPIFIISILNLELTGNAINKIMGPEASNVLQLSLIVFLAALICVIIYSFIWKKRYERRFKKHTGILERIVSRKTFQTK